MDYKTRLTFEQIKEIPDLTDQQIDEVLQKTIGEIHSQIFSPRIIYSAFRELRQHRKNQRNREA